MSAFLTLNPLDLHKQTHSAFLREKLKASVQNTCETQVRSLLQVLISPIKNGRADCVVGHGSSGDRTAHKPDIVLAMPCILSEIYARISFAFWVEYYE